MKLAENTGNKKGGLQTALTALAAVFLLLHLVLRFTGVAVWDDAYIFYRYAAHCSAGEGFIWNPGESHGYGTTSVLWTMLLSFCTSTGAGPAALLYGASIFMGLVLVSMIGFSTRRLSWLLPLLLLANAPSLAEHFSSGMDTALVLVFVFAFVICASRMRGNVITGVIGGVAWLVRPELSVLCFGVLLIMAWQDRRQGVKVWVTPALALVVTWACLTLCQKMLGSALPIPFYSKTGAHQDAGIRQLYRWEGLKQFALFLLVNAPLFWIIFRSRKGMLATLHWWLPAAAVTLFYLLGVTQIMGYSQRFYYHLWPLWLFAAMQVLRTQPQPVLPLRWLLPLATAAGLLVTVLQGRPESVAARWGRFDLAGVYKVSGREYNWPLLDEVHNLPTDVAVATTEIGLPAAWDIDRPVYDMGGLTDPGRLQGAALVEDIVSHRLPDVIWMPNPHYTGLHQHFSSSAAFARAYEVYPADTLNAIQGIALRKAAPDFASLRQQVAQYIAAHK